MMSDVSAAHERYLTAADAHHAAVRESLRLGEARTAAYAEYDRLRLLALPLRTALLERLDPAVQCRKAVSVSRAAGWVYRAEGEVRAELEALAADGLIRKFGNGYVSLNPHSVGAV